MSVEDGVPSREEMLKRLRVLNERFYWMCFKAEVGAFAHPFLEFNGLMAKYIDCLERARVDPHQVSVHGGELFDVKDHDLAYMADKLQCIFAPIIAANPNARDILSEHLFGKS